MPIDNRTLPFILKREGVNTLMGVNPNCPHLTANKQNTNK